MVTGGQRGWGRGGGGGAGVSLAERRPFLALCEPLARGVVRTAHVDVPLRHGVNQYPDPTTHPNTGRHNSICKKWRSLLWQKVPRTRQSAP
eukprot:COSAG04_NODE_21710_length_369_cov_0.577778_2_plen_90_part_01